MKELIHSLMFILIGVAIILMARELKDMKNLIIKQSKSETIIKTVEKSISPIPYNDLGIYTISHYCDCPICTGTQKGSRTASGIKPKEGRTIACDGKILKMGDIVYISGYGVYVCEDKGSAITKNKIDLYVNKHNEAINNGIKKARVYKLGKS